MELLLYGCLTTNMKLLVRNVVSKNEVPFTFFGRVCLIGTILCKILREIQKFQEISSSSHCDVFMTSFGLLSGFATVAQCL